MKDRPDALDELTEMLRALATDQRMEADPAHEDFYAWGWVLGDLTYRLSEVCSTLAQQVERYGDRRILRDDQGGDPADRLVAMRELLSRLAGELRQAEATARAYHNEASHIGVEVDPNTATEP